MSPAPLQECVNLFLFGLLLIDLTWCVGMYSTTVWLGDDPYLFLPCCLIICMTVIYFLCR